MGIILVRDDITKVKADAIVDSTNKYLKARGMGLSGSIHTAAGPELQKELNTIGHCDLGQAVITGSYGIKTCKYIIHTVAPKFYNWERNEKELLQSCYKNIFRLADENGCMSIAMPLLSAGQHGMPVKDAYDILLECVRKYIQKNMKKKVYIVLYGSRITKHIRDSNPNGLTENITDKYLRINRALIEDYYRNGPDSSVAISAVFPEGSSEAPEYKKQELGFAQMCRWWMKEKEIKPKNFYFNSDICKSSFSNLINNDQAIPKKFTVFSCCIGLELDYDESRDLMRRAGYSFSHYYELDRMMEKFILQGDYNIYYIKDSILNELGLVL